MDTVRSNYKALALVLNLNWELILYAATIAFALFVGSFFGMLFFPIQ
ncbi:MAG: hypothetical protein ABJO67_19140 [Pseudoruegeria sp.]